MAAPEGEAADDVLTLQSAATIHLFRPRRAAEVPTPVIVYLHGGSFFAGGVTSHGPLARVLADRTGLAVALIDYRLAPESKAPAALEDGIQGVRALRAQSDELRLDLTRIALLGDSAGGALTAGLALALRGEVTPYLVVLVNPMTSPAADEDPSFRKFASGYFAGAQDFTAGWSAYRGADDGGPFFDLLTVEDLRGFPRTIVLTNEADPVRDQGERFAEKLSQAGAHVLSLRARGLVHAAWLFPAALPEAHLLLATITGALASTLHSE